MKYDVIVVGAGISGLICAKKLIEAGFSVLLIEKNNYIGGKVNSENNKGFTVDKGFHVVLTNYPEIKRNISIDQLKPLFLSSSCEIWDGRRMLIFANPFESIMDFAKGIKTPIFTIKDLFLLGFIYLKIKLNFKYNANTTVSTYFSKIGFSEKFIRLFLRPFFSGVFLENKLRTKMNKFQEVFKSFTDGNVFIPSDGINSLAQQIAKNIPEKNIILEKEVVSISSDNTVSTIDKSKYSAKVIVIATDKLNFEYLAYRKKRNVISSNFNKSKTLYFSIDDNPELKKFYLYLNGSNEGIINNLIFLSNDKYPQGKIITSITIFKSLDLQQDVLAKKVIKELKLIFPDKINNHELIKIFSINESIKNSIDHEYNLCISKNLYFCGEHCGVASLNTALKTGRVAAERIIEIKNKRLDY